MFLADKLQQLAADLSVFDDPQERLGLLVERTKRLPSLPPQERTEQNRVRGCVSVVWLLGEARAGRGYFRSDAESPIVRALVASLCDFFSGALLTEIAAYDSDPLDALDVTRNLSPTRRHGLAAARKAIREFARTNADKADKAS